MFNRALCGSARNIFLERRFSVSATVTLERTTPVFTAISKVSPVTMSENNADNILNYINGSFIPSTEAKVAVNDLCVLRGFGVFDYLRTYHQGHPFRLEEHVRRLRYSADQIGLHIIEKDSDIMDIVHETIAKNTTTSDSHEWGIRLIATGGMSHNGFLPVPGKSQFLVLMDPLQTDDASLLAHPGIHVATSRVPNPFPTIKSTNYLGAVMAAQEAQDKGCQDALYIDGHGPNTMVTECTRANIFFVLRDSGVVVTPNQGILEGITRRAVLDVLSASPSYDIEERPISLTEVLDSAIEAFVTSTTKEITPVLSIDGVAIGTGEPGPVTRDIHRLLQAFVREATIGNP